MNLKKIQEALNDAVETKQLYEGIDGDDWHWWDGYEAALTYAISHLKEENQNNAT